MMRKYVLSILCSLLLLPGCNYLDMVPEKDIETIESVFEQRSKVETWWMGLYGELQDALLNLKMNPAFAGADELVPSPFLFNFRHVYSGYLVATGQQMSQEPYGNIWFKMYQIIRNANTFLAHVDNTYNMTKEERTWWKADVKALKAYVYFELVRTYGPICLVPQNMPVDLDVKHYQLPRQPVDSCFKEIIRLLDEAEPNIPMNAERDYFYAFTFSKEAVYALKARTLLYAASPLFNGNAFYSDFKNKNGELLFNPTYDRNKWLLAAEAADKAVEICLQGDRKFAPKGSDKKTKLLNHMSDIEKSTYSRFDNPEFLFELKGGLTSWYATTLPRLEGNPYHFDHLNQGCISPSMKMIEMYYTANGLPIDADLNWNNGNRYKRGSEGSFEYEGVVALNTDMVNLHLRREPRFYAHIAGDRMYWQRGISTLSRDNNLLVEAHKDESWGTKKDIIVSNDFQNICGYWLKKCTYSWLPTIGYFNSLPKEATTPLIRLAEVYLMQAEAWNEYLDQPDDRVYDPLDKVRERAGILPVREAWKTYSNQPAKVDSKEGMRDIIRQENNIEFAFEGHRYWNIRRWLIAHKEMNSKHLGWNVLGMTTEAFYNNWENPIEIGVKNKFIAPRDYLAPFKAEEILISGMVQNPGW